MCKCLQCMHLSKRVHDNCCIFYCRFKIATFILTYLAYTCYHMSRKPISVVKSVLQSNCTYNASLSLPATATYNLTGQVPFLASSLGLEVASSTASKPLDCGYAPFGE